MSEPDLATLQSAIEPYLPLGRSGLMPALHAAQKIYGWISEPVATEIAKSLRVPLADVHGVIEFYSMYYNEPVGKKFIRVCTDQACALKDANGLLNHLCAHHGIKPGQTTPDGATTIEASPCLGLCEQAPAILYGDEAETNVNLKTGSYELGRPRSIVGGSLRLLTVNCGNGSTTPLEGYGEYSALKKARGMKREDIINEVKASGLVGRGGAAFPTGVKWDGTAKAEGSPKYIICNADESEPGTFKDRILLLDDPHRILEGMTIAAHAIGASKGFIYIRGEYPYIVPVLENALREARSAGYLNEDFDIEIRVGAGAYICGEETALFESIEGKRGFPRVKPPFPTTFGVFGKPTAINNVETLCNVPLIVSLGAAEYRRIGTEKSPGPKLFCVSGDVAKPGVYEVPFGVTLRELLDMAGGVADKNKLQAVLFGGAAGAFATSAHLDVKMTFEDLRAAGLPLGSGVVLVYDETRDMRDAFARLGHFFAHESCGKCYPCQMGTQRQMEILNRISEGKMQEGDLARLQDVGWTMTDASLCGLGQTAASAILSAIKLWPEVFTVSVPRSSVANRRKETKMYQTLNPDPNQVPMPPMQEPEPVQVEMPQPVVEQVPATPAPAAVPVKKAVRKPVAKKKKPVAKKKVAKRAKPARRKSVAKKSARKPVRKTARKPVRKVARKAVRKAARRPAKKSRRK